MRNYFLLILFPFSLFSFKTEGSKLNELQIEKLKHSIVRVEAKINGKKQLGTGFAYKDKKYIVTAFHVIAGSNGNVLISYPTFGISDKKGKVIKTLQSADLALIEVSEPLEIEPLQGSTSPSIYNSEYTAIGFLWDASDYFPKDIVRKGLKRLEDFLPSTTKNDLRNSHCPSLNLSVITFDGNPLVPGYSGSPIFSGDEKIIGVGDGGIQSGLASVSWAIPISSVEQLYNSNENISGIINSTVSHFSADKIEFENWQNTTIELNNVKFTKLRTQKLGEILNTTDDVLGLNQILSTFPSQMDKYNISFDVYQDFSSGATFILPTDLTFEISTNEIIVHSSDNKAEFTLQLEKLEFGTQFEIQTSTVDLETEALNDPPNGWYWFPDRAFTYFYPINRPDGFIVMRKAFLLSKQNINMTYSYRNYLFESFAYKNKLLMYLNTTNRNYNDTYFLEQTQCNFNGFNGSDCQEILHQLKDWGSLIIATHFATFSFSN